MPDHWITDEGLAFDRLGELWRVSVVRDLPQRLGLPEEIDLPAQGGRVSQGDVLLAVELSKARVEFTSPAALIVCESRHEGPHHPLDLGGIRLLVMIEGDAQSI